MYGGVIILPHGGAWKIHADVLALKKVDSDPPLHVTRGEIAIQRESGLSLSAENAADRAAKPKANAFNEMVLAIHTLAAGAWAAVLGILLLFTFRRAKFLSAWGRNVIEQHLDSIIRSASVATLIVIVTGVFNIYREAPYKLTSPSLVSEVLNLPFGRPYFLALVIKLTAYGALLAESAYLVRRARLDADHPEGRAEVRQVGTVGGVDVGPWAARRNADDDRIKRRYRRGYDTAG